MRCAVAMSFHLISPAAAQTVAPANPKSGVNALPQMGHRATLEAASDGDPRVRSTVEGVRYGLWFYGCRSNRGSDSLTLSTGFNGTNGSNLRVMTAWNETKLLGRASLGEPINPFLDSFIEAEGGLPYETFEAAITSWGRAISQSKRYIGW